MKRILALMLCMMVAVSLVPCVYGAEADNTYEVERALGILNAIGNFTEYDMATVEQTKQVTRGEFAEGLADLLKLESNSDKLFYHDVSGEHFAYNGITALTEAGYMNGCGNNLFEPERIMTIHEASIVLVSVLGYKHEAQAKGGGEFEYTKIASRLELFDGTVSNGDLLFGDMLVLFSNVLTVPLLEVTGWGDKTVYEESVEETLLSVYYNSHYGMNERVTSANNTGIYAETRHDGYITIGSGNYIPNSENMEMYLGNYVNFIYKGDPDKEICEIIWIEKDPNYDELILTADVIQGFDSSSYTYGYYAESGSLRKVELSRNISVIYNGGFEKDSERILKLPCTEIRFLKNKNGEFDVAIISDYRNYLIDSVYVTDKIIFTRNGNDTIDTDEFNYEKMLVLDANGEIKSPDDLASDMTISVFKSSPSADGSYIKIIYSEATVEGVAESVKTSSDNVTYVTIDGVEYRLSDSVDKNDLKLGKTVFVYLDYNNQISYVKQNYASVYMAYITNLATDGLFSSALKIKAFNQDNVLAVYDTAPKFKVEDTEYSNPTGSEFDTIANTIRNKLAILTFDSEGRIKTIDIAGGHGDLEIMAEFANCSYRGVSPKIGKLTCIDSSTKIFSVPNETEDAEAYEFGIINKSRLVDWSTFYAQSYQYSDETDYAGAVVIQGFKWNEPTSSSTAFVYAESYQMMNEDGEAVTVLHGFEGATVKDYYCISGYEPVGLTVGCAVFPSVNNRGEVINIMETIFSRASTGGDGGAGLTANRRVVVGYVSSRKGNVIRVGYTDPNATDERFDCSNTPILVVDEAEKEKVTLGTVADIFEGDKVAIQTMQMSQRMIVVYK